MQTRLSWPFTSWTIDDNGTIHTPSGYRCTPAIIESALWLMTMGETLHGRHTLFADTPLVKPRHVFDVQDLIDKPKTPQIHTHRKTSAGSGAR